SIALHTQLDEKSPEKDFVCTSIGCLLICRSIDTKFSSYLSIPSEFLASLAKSNCQPDRIIDNACRYACRR
ncbi:hypothetical protein, partial [Chamaesiphon sp. VAR_69_metabat_338]|uniref:hypothetical protein n=1 Tax=Chamaesiphon sp. VAR_69_metabat_338 TaxID=2964704 RepID=UPI00286DF6CC